MQARFPFISKEQVNKRKIETKAARESRAVHFCFVELNSFELVAHTSQYTPPKVYEDLDETKLTICSNGVPSTWLYERKILEEKTMQVNITSATSAVAKVPYPSAFSKMSTAARL